MLADRLFFVKPWLDSTTSITGATAHIFLTSCAGTDRERLFLANGTLTSTPVDGFQGKSESLLEERGLQSRQERRYNDRTKRYNDKMCMPEEHPQPPPSFGAGSARQAKRHELARWEFKGGVSEPGGGVLHPCSLEVISSGGCG